MLQTTSQPSLSYIGFSQGTAQAFAGLSIHPKLNEQVDLFIALAPAMSPAGLSNSVVDALVKASPEVLYLAFGRKSILASATMWQAILPPWIFVKIIDLGLSFLFGWKAQNISAAQKLAAYSHLYSFTSTKSVVHWFQIIRNKSFQMFDDEASSLWNFGAATSRSYKVAKFPTKTIKTPVKLLYGGSDSLVDIRVMKKQLPEGTTAIEVPTYEHLDFLWAEDVDKMVFPHVFDALGETHRQESDDTEVEKEDHHEADDGDVDADLLRKDDGDDGTENHHHHDVADGELFRGADDTTHHNRHESDDAGAHHDANGDDRADFSSPPTTVDDVMEVDEEEKDAGVVIAVDEVMVTDDEEAAIVGLMEEERPSVVALMALEEEPVVEAAVDVPAVPVVTIMAADEEEESAPAVVDLTTMVEESAPVVALPAPMPAPTTTTTTTKTTRPTPIPAKAKKDQASTAPREPYWKKIKNSRKVGRPRIPVPEPRKSCRLRR